MNEHLYIKFFQKPVDVQDKLSFKKKYNLIRTLLFFIPKANPDFENQINDVAEWQIELSSKDHLPVRELGLDQNGKVIVAMPLNNNIGYWTDNNLTLEDFKLRFNAIDIEKGIFESNWLSFVNNF